MDRLAAVGSVAGTPFTSAFAVPASDAFSGARNSTSYDLTGPPHFSAPTASMVSIACAVSPRRIVASALIPRIGRRNFIGLARRGLVAVGLTFWPKLILRCTFREPRNPRADRLIDGRGH